MYLLIPSALNGSLLSCLQTLIIIVIVIMSPLKNVLLFLYEYLHVMYLRPEVYVYVISNVIYNKVFCTLYVRYGL